MSTGRRVTRMHPACLLGLAGLSASACRTVDDCVGAQIVVNMPASVMYRGRSTSETFQGSVSAGTVGPTVFAGIEQTFLTESGPFGAVAWSAGGRFGELGGGALGVGVPTPLAVGAVRLVDTVFRPGGWGPTLLLPGSMGAVWIVAGLYRAVDAAGSVTVLSNAPLRFRYDLTAVDAAADTLALRGDMIVIHYPERGSCEGIAQRLSGPS